MLEILTDPSVDLVEANRRLSQDVKDRESRIAVLQSEVDNLRARVKSSEAARVKTDRDGLDTRCELRTLRHDHARLQDEHKKLVKEYAKFKKDHARRGR